MAIRTVLTVLCILCAGATLLADEGDDGVWPKDRAYYLREPVHGVWPKAVTVDGQGVLESIRTEIPADTDALEALVLTAGAKKNANGKWDLSRARIPLSDMNMDGKWGAMLTATIGRGLAHPKRQSSVRIGNFIFLPPSKNGPETDLSISLLTPEEYLRRGGALFEKRNALEKECQKGMTGDLRQQMYRTAHAMQELGIPSDGRLFPFLKEQDDESRSWSHFTDALKRPYVQEVLPPAIVFFILFAVVIFRGFRRRQKSMEATLSLPLSQHSEKPVVCRFGVDEKCSVTLDLAAGMIHFQNCLGTFLTGIQPEIRCQLDDVLLVDIFPTQYGSFLEIVTKSGSVNIPSGASNCTELYTQLKNCIPDGRRGAEIFKPVMGFGAFGFGLFGSFLGGFLTPANSSNAMLGVCITLGLAIGLVVPFVVVWYADNVLRISIATPLALAVFGACVALFFSLDWPNGWKNVAAFCFATLSGGAGGLIMYGLCCGLFRMFQLLPYHAHRKPYSMPPTQNTPRGED